MSMVNLPRHWKIARFGEVATFTKKPRDLQYSEYDEIPFVPMDLIPIAKLFSEQFTLKKNGELSSGTYFEPGDILLAKITPSFENGKQCVIKELPTPFGIATTEVIPIREVAGVSDKFYLFYCLLMPDVRTLLAGRMQGTTGRQRLGKETLVSLEIPLPPLPEQRAIAHVLQTIQDAKFARQRELALERERKAALMDYLFSHGTKGEPRKQTEIGEIPESWDVVRLGEIVKESIKDGVHQTPTYVEDGVSFVTAKDIVSNKISFAECAYISLEEHETLIKRVKPEIGDVLLTKVGTIGNVALVDVSQEFSIFVQVALIKPKSDIIDSGFLLYVLQSEKGQTEINRKSAQSTMRFIGVQKISTVYIPLPSLPEQVEIAELLQSFDKKITALEHEAERLDELFHAMLDELMTGKRSAMPLIDAGLPN